MEKLSDKIGCLHGVGERRAQLYNKLNVETIADLLRFYPRDYLDLTKPVSIAESCINETNVIKATVYKKNGEQFIRRGLTFFKVFVTDQETNMVITIFNSRYQFDELLMGHEYFFIGKVTGSLLKREMASPNFVDADSQCLMRPIYPLTQGISNKMIQSHIKQALQVFGDCLDDCLPQEIKQENNLCQLRFAVENIHFPKDEKALAIAQNRLIFEELLILQLGLLLLRQKNRKETTVILSAVDMVDFYNALPFTLTDGQQKAIDDALKDMSAMPPIPMNRLVQGDVGSGKTMVAAALAFACFKNGFQTAIMAPTQILADQHYATLNALLSPLGINCCQLTGSQKVAQRRTLLAGIESGEYHVVIGTHALVQDSVIFAKLGLVVTDEQHRFGVEQRAKLAGKGDNPHLLIMSATPIPRTLALIIYGDLDISAIRELPKGRKPIETFVINSKKRARALNFIKKQIDEGRQAYIVCPLIEENVPNAESESYSSPSDLVSINEYMAALTKTPLAQYKIESLNGKLKSSQKEEIMARFKNNETQILVATTVIEVGVDVPNANIMLIENAERFGLSQLHQLRGRVGRGEFQSYCVLLSDNQGEDNQKRLEVMKTNTDGFVIADEDLKLRGPGDFFGFKQHGLPEMKIASLLNDMETLNKTRAIAQAIISADKTLSLPKNSGLREQVDTLFCQNKQEIMS